VILDQRDKLLEKFRDVAISRGGILWFKPNDAIRLLEEARAHHVPVLGIDGAFIRSETTQPSMADSIDYTGMRVPPVDIYDDAIGFLHCRSNADIYFEIVLGKVVEGKQ
jgi:hypothetical protein